MSSSRQESGANEPGRPEDREKMHTILLVDDTKTFLDLETTYLSRAECRLLTAGTGLECVRLAKIERPDLVVLDIEMPEMNGIQACRILKADPATRGIPIIILTSMKMEDEARRAGAEHYLRKPIDEPRFLAEIKKFLPIKERNETRVPLEVPITFWRDEEPFHGRLVNLSKTGLFVSIDSAPPVGARIELSFSLLHDFSGRLITAEALVVWNADTPVKGFGARFFQIGTNTRQLVEEFVDRLGVRQGVGT